MKLFGNVNRSLSESTPEQLAENQRVLSELKHIQDMIIKMGTNYVGPMPGQWSEAKIMRWMGFIQGVFWARHIYTIDEMRDHNR